MTVICTTPWTERGDDQRLHRADEGGRAHEQRRLAELRQHDERGRRPHVLHRDGDQLEERSDRPQQHDDAEQSGQRGQLRRAEQPDDEARPNQQQHGGAAAHAGEEREDVGDDRRLPGRFPRQEIEGAHREAEREQVHRRGHDEEGLLVEAEILLREAPHQQQRQRDGEGEADGLRHHQPDGLAGERRARARLRRHATLRRTVPRPSRKTPTTSSDSSSEPLPPGSDAVADTGADATVV